MLTLPYNQSEAVLRDVLAQHVAGAKIVRLIRPLHLFGGWTDTQLQASFEVHI